MMLTRAVLALTLAALPLAVSACQKAQQPPAPKVAETTAAPVAPQAGLDPKAVGDFTIIGLVTKVEDAAYPMFALTVLPDGAKETLGLLYNNEAAKKPEGLEISGFENQRAEIAFTRKPQLDLIDVTLAGKSLLKHEPGDPTPTPEATVTGKLSGAAKISGGDLPDVITVTDAGGKTYDFEMFISDKPLVAANRKQVTVSYSNSMREDVKAIKLTPPKS